MSISQLISLICIVLFVVFAVLFCAIVWKVRKSKETEVDLEKNCENGSHSKPPRKTKRKRKIKPCFYEDQIQIQVPSNTPTFIKFKRKQFQPMNYEEGHRLKRKKHKSLKHSVSYK